jgi:hypothetical protein
MRFRLRLFFTLVFALTAVAMLMMLSLFTQSAQAQGPWVRGPFVTEAIKAASFDGDVRQLPNVAPTNMNSPHLRLARNGASAAAATPNDPMRQIAQSAFVMPPPIQNFSGISRTTLGLGVWPPDPNGDVGRNHYIQTVNLAVGIYDKTGTPLATFPLAALFTATKTLCDTTIRGDPVVVYDALADRWLITTFAFQSNAGPFYQCVAASKTGDPVTGGWWIYGMLADNQHLNDYVKIALWPDAYYMTANMFDMLSNSPLFIGVRAWALDRLQIYNGVLRSVSFDVAWNASSGCCYALLPSNLRGALPPAGAPNVLMASQILPNNTGGLLYLWRFHVDWTCPLTCSTLSAPINIPVSTFTDIEGNVVPQKGSAEMLDAGDAKLMMQLQYRNMGSADSLWAAQTVGGTGGATAIRWYEVRNPFTSPVLYQQGTYQPDGNYRWMPSLAVDRNGSMALGYSVSGAAMFPAIRYAGRLPTDPLGVLAQGETSLIEGAGSQVGGASRWGDYSAMTVDPIDDCTFWYTNMYYATNGNNWQTRIGSFQMPMCTAYTQHVYLPVLAR